MEGDGENANQADAGSGRRGMGLVARLGLNSRLLAPTQASLAKSRAGSAVPSGHVAAQDASLEASGNHGSHSSPRSLSPRTPSPPPSKYLPGGRLRPATEGSGERGRNGESGGEVGGHGRSGRLDFDGRRRSLGGSPAGEAEHARTSGKVWAEPESSVRVSPAKKVTAVSEKRVEQKEVRAVSSSVNVRRHSLGSSRNEKVADLDGKGNIFGSEVKGTARERLFPVKFSKNLNPKGQEAVSSAELKPSERSSAASKSRSGQDGSKRESKLHSDDSARRTNAGNSNTSSSDNGRQFASPPSGKARDAGGHASGEHGKAVQRDERDSNVMIGTPRHSGAKMWNMVGGKEGGRWNEGEYSPVSTLDLVLPDESVSPVDSEDGLRHSTGGGSMSLSGLNIEGRSNGEACMLDFQRHLGDVVERLTMSQSKASSCDTADSLEFASLDFIGEVEGMEQDLEYVRQILVVSGFSAETLPPWHSAQLPMNPAVFEQLELGIALGASNAVGSSGRPSLDAARRSEERRQRMLLFDAVNEALGRRLAPFVTPPPWVKREKPTIRPRPTGKDLLQEVWLEVHDWPVPTSDEVYDILDDAARRDMTRGLEKWVEIGEERAEVVFELEAMVMQEMLVEMVLEFTAVEEKRRARQRGVLVK